MKKAITTEEMKALFLGEYAAQRPPQCNCDIPNIRNTPGLRLGESYWFMDSPKECGAGCRSVLATIWAKLSEEYSPAVEKYVHPSQARGARKVSGARVPILRPARKRVL